MSRKTEAEKQRENTERIALELYQNRLRLGRPGDAQSDWEKAEKIVQNSLRAALYASNRHLIKIRHITQKAFNFIVLDIPKWFIFSLPKLEWMKLLAVPLVIAAASSIITSRIQREATQNTILKEYLDQLEKLIFEKELLTSSPEDAANIVARGRTVTALKELDLKRRQQLIAFLDASGLLRSKDALRGPVVDPTFDHSKSAPAVVSFDYQDLSDLDLQGIDFYYGNFKEANLSGSNLSKASLDNANFDSARLIGTNLQESFLLHANLHFADLRDANLKKAILPRANLELAWLENVNLNEANLHAANLSGAVLGFATLKNARLTETNLSGADLVEANVTQEQLTQAKLCRTILPTEITLDPNRDCEELGLDPETGERLGR